MPSHAWLFEADSIQSYIHDSGRLLDAVGASLLVDRLCGQLESGDSDDLLSRVLTAADVDARHVSFSRRGGGAFIAFLERPDDRRRARALWALALAEHAPGLRWGDAVADGLTAFDAARDGMGVLRQSRLTASPALPEAGPLVRLSPRTGLPAVENTSIAGSREFTDAETRAKRAAGQLATGVARRFSDDDQLKWPRRLELDNDDDHAFPFLPGQNELVFLHADGNGLGAALQALARAGAKDPGNFVADYAAFSKAVSQATAAAARHATAAVLRPDERGRMPARPLVLGGDDVSIIVRPDLAIPFAEAFLRQFELESARELQAAWGNRQIPPGIPQSLSAACGMAVVNSSYPFIRAAELASQMCDAAKRSIKRAARDAKREVALSALMFCRITAALPDEDHADGALDVVPGSGGTLRLAGGPYVLADAQGATDGLPTLHALRSLADELGRDDAARGPSRQVLTLLFEHAALAQRTWDNWRRSLSRMAPERLKSLDAALSALGVRAGAGALPFGAEDAAGARSTPISDAMILRDLEAT